MYICPLADGQPVWILEFPPWWDRSDFFKRFGSRQVESEGLVDVNFGLLLAVGEVLEWDKRCREMFNQEARSKHPFFVESMHRWESMLKACRWVIVESYEWESGLS